MRVKMKVQITGTRNGEYWPARGGVMELPEAEAENLILSGYAEKAEDEKPVEAAVKPDKVETAVVDTQPHKKRGRPRREV